MPKKLKTKLDQIEKNILESLQDNGRITNVELAKANNLAPSSMLERVRRLESRGIIKDFCVENSITYHETTLWQSYVEVLSYLYRVGSPLRQPSLVLDESPTV